MTREADESETFALSSIQHALRSAGFVAPDDVGDTAPGEPAVAVYVLPGEGKGGALEDLCLAAVDRTPLASCVEAYIECLRTTASWQPQNAVRASKARVRAWLAAQEDPETRLGLAALAGYWPLDAPAFAPLRQFLVRAFQPPKEPPTDGA